MVAAISATMWAADAEAGLREWWFGQPWEFVQSVGGIRVGAATRGADGTVSIAIDCDVSGTRSTTQEPVALHSAVGVEKILASVEDHQIELSVRTALGQPSSCTPIQFKNLEPGKYLVVYLGADRSPHEVGTVEVR